MNHLVNLRLCSSMTLVIRPCHHEHDLHQAMLCLGRTLTGRALCCPFNLALLAIYTWKACMDLPIGVDPARVGTEVDVDWRITLTIVFMGLLCNT